MFRKATVFLLIVMIVSLVLSCSKKPVPPKSSPPVINGIEASPNIVSKNGSVYLNLAVNDPDEDKMYFEWSSTPDSGKFYSDSLFQNESNTANPCWWKAPSVEGNYTLFVTCTDSIGEKPEFVDTNVTVSVSIYSLDTIIGESKFTSPFAMYLDSSGSIYVTDPGLSAVHYYNGAGWLSWNFAGLDTTIKVDTTIDTTVTPWDTLIDTTYLCGKSRLTTPSAITVDENRHLLYVADVLIDSTRLCVFNLDSMFTPSDTVIIHLSDTLLDTVCLYGFQFRMNDKNNLYFTIKAPYSFVIDPSSDWLYISTGISIIAYDTTWSHNGWKKHWSYSIATGGVNYEGHGMKLYNGDLYLATFGVKNDTLYNLVRRFTDITSTSSPTEDFYFSDTSLQYINGIAIGQDGHIFVTEGGGSYSYHRVVEYDENGSYVRSFGSLGDRVDQFNCPTDIFIDSSGKIYVVDMGNHSIKVFKK